MIDKVIFDNSVLHIIYIKIQKDATERKYVVHRATTVHRLNSAARPEIFRYNKFHAPIVLGSFN